MKYRDAVRKYFNKRVEHLERIIHFKSASYKPETFHKLRVEIKKINAVFELVNFCEKNFKRKKTFKPFKDLFKKAAAVRDLQVELALLRKYKIAFLNNSYAKELTNNLKQAKEKFHKAINEKLLHQLDECSKEAYNAVSQLNNKDVNQYFKKTAGEINSLLQKKLKPEQLHGLRKKLKTFYYNLKSCNADQKNFSFDKINSFAGASRTMA
jgi:CHAD domain-containing protein